MTARIRVQVEGDPSPRSPKNVAQDTSYESVPNFVRGNYWPSADELIVKHKTTGTFWLVVYQVRADDSDYGMSATWKQVRPEIVTLTKYVVVDS